MALSTHDDATARGAVFEAAAPAATGGVARAAAAAVDLVRRRGRAAELGREDGVERLDWVDGVARLVDDSSAVERVVKTAATLVGRDTRHLVWAGMGGSVNAVRVLVDSGALRDSCVQIHPLDSTDPTALNRLLRDLTGEPRPGHDALRSALQRMVMLGVSMGLTSEEPLTHLEWFTDILETFGVAPVAEHVAVMTLEGSVLAELARHRGLRLLPVQTDGANGTPGRMSAPSTHVFLIPAALALGAGAGAGGNAEAARRLLAVLSRCQALYGLRSDLADDELDGVARRDPFVALAAWLDSVMRDGRARVLMDASPDLRPLLPWIEQVVEESLGKGGRGIVVFRDQVDASMRESPSPLRRLRLARMPDDGARQHDASILLAGAGGSVDDDLAGMARAFAGWNLAVALVGTLQSITYVGQSAVEGYKRHARALRDLPRLPFPQPPGAAAASEDGVLVATYPPGAIGNGQSFPSAVLDATLASAAARCAALIRARRTADRLGYLDVTLNGAQETPGWREVADHARRLANVVLGCPVKVRSAPQQYHATEQSETDGPDELVSIRIVLLRTEPVLAGTYGIAYLHAQALGSIRAMHEAGRDVIGCFVTDASRLPAVARLLDAIAAELVEDADR
jgi:hypothetical protein